MRASQWEHKAKPKGEAKAKDGELVFGRALPARREDGRRKVVAPHSRGVSTRHRSRLRVFDVAGGAPLARTLGPERW